MSRPGRALGSVEALASIVPRDPLGIAIDKNNQLYVSNYDTSTIARFKEDDFGDVAPQAIIEGHQTLLEQLGEDRELPEELNERLLDGMIDRLIAGKRGEREILGSDGVLGELTRRLLERALGEELTEQLGYPAGQAPLGGAGNQRVHANAFWCEFRGQRTRHPR